MELPTFFPAPFEVGELTDPVGGNFFFLFFGPVEDLVFPFKEGVCCFTSKERFDPVGKFERVTPKVLMTPETMCNSRAGVISTGHVGSPDQMATV